MNYSAALARISIPLVAVLISCLFSVYSIISNPLLNNDAYSYLRAAEVFSASGIGAVLDQYGWYGYSILIALLDQVMPGGLVASAHVLNTLSFALLTFTFIKICTALHNTRRIEFFAALIILGFPLLNEMRYFLIRDVAFWATTLLGFVLLLRYQRTRTWWDALCCVLALMAAVVFRLEGLLFAAIAPLSLLTGPATRALRLRLAARLLLLASGAAAVVFFAALVAGHNLLSLMQYAYRFYLPLLFNMNELIQTTAHSLGQTIFTAENFPDSDDTGHGLVVLIFAYCYAVLSNLVNALGLPLAILLVYAYVRGHLVMPTPVRGPLITYIVSSLLALLCFIFIMQFLTQRYATLTCLLLLTLAPLALNNIYAVTPARKFAVIFGSLYAYLLIDSLFTFGHSKRYIDEASMWFAEQAPANASLHTNNFALAYASGRIADYDRISLSAEETLLQSRSADYLMLDVKHDDAAIRTLLDTNAQLHPLQSFANARGDEIRIYLLR